MFLWATVQPTHLMVLQFTTHHSEGIVGTVVVYLNFGQALGIPARHPLPVRIIIHHHGGPRCYYCVFTKTIQQHNVNPGKIQA